jgi:hypothetical protein
VNKKYALTIGINDYPGQYNDLSGCVNDARDWAHFVEMKDFMPDLLLDDDATKSNILWMLKRHVAFTGYRDTLVVCFSGHGTRVPDNDGDEADRLDEAICAYDFQNNGLITDDELYEVFKGRNYGSRIFFFSDSCHSGSVNRLVGNGVPNASRDRIKFMPPAQFMDGAALRKTEQLFEANAVKATSRSSAVLISGCMDEEYSYDAWFGNRPNGAFTRRALDVYQSGMTIKQWHQAIRAGLPNDFHPQTPQLSATWAQKYWKVFR